MQLGYIWLCACITKEISMALNNSHWYDVSADVVLSDKDEVTVGGLEESVQSSETGWPHDHYTSFILLKASSRCHTRVKQEVQCCIQISSRLFHFSRPTRSWPRTTKSATRTRWSRGRTTWWRSDERTWSESRPGPPRKDPLLKLRRPRKEQKRLKRLRRSPLKESQKRAGRRQKVALWKLSGLLRRHKMCLSTRV